MTKKTPDPRKFEDFVKTLSEKDRDLIKELNINSIEELLDATRAMIAEYTDRIKETSDNIDCSTFDDDEDMLDYDDCFVSGDPNLLPPIISFDEETPLAYHFRIKLEDCAVPVWREIEVPSNISLEFFAHIILYAMGWDNMHLHQFYRKNTYYRRRYDILQDREMGFFPAKYTNLCSENYPLSAIFREKKDSIKFEYDFGDSWIHKIWLKGIREYDSNETPGLKKLKGKGACPPEDCGGLGGYDYILRLLNEKGLSQEEREHLTWYGIDTDFDPNIFDIEYSSINLNALWEDATL